jgi:hypothetical protein
MYPTQINIILSKQIVVQAIPYYCMRCKTRLFDINHDILALWMGQGYPAHEIPNNMGWVRHQCKGCKKEYNWYFQ